MPPQGVRRHQHRDDLTGEHKSGDMGQIIFACVFAAVWVSDAFFLQYSTLLNQYVPFLVRLPISITLLALAAYLSLSGVRTVFGEKRSTPAVIRKGVFGMVRHPIYLGEILLYLGLFARHMSLAALGVLIAVAVFLHYISRYEEKLLVERFGKDYQDYMQSVPMWIPRLRRR